MLWERFPSTLLYSSSLNTPHKGLPSISEQMAESLSIFPLPLVSHCLMPVYFVRHNVSKSTCATSSSKSSSEDAKLMHIIGLN